MATDRVGIEIDIMGYQEALSQMKNLERSMKGLSGRKNYLRIKAEVEKLRINKNALRAQKIKLQADLSDVDRKLNRLKSKYKSLMGQLPLYKKGSPAYNRLTAEIGRLRNEIASVNGQKINIQTNLKQTQAEINANIAALQRLEAALRNVKSMSAGQIFKGVSSSIGHLGSAMQSAGNAIQRFMTPLRMLTSGIFIGAVYRGIHTITEGLGSGLERYDIMHTYAPVMKALGQNVDKVDKKGRTVVDRLNEAVLGLPTGLQEIVEQHKLLTLALDDVDKAEKLAIASNNAWIASGADEARVTMAKKELQTLAQTGKLNERQWMTLQKGMAPSWKQIEKSMQKSGEISGSLLENVKDGTISAERFMEAFTWEGINGKTAEATEEMKHTFQAVTANIKNAFSRMSKNIIDTLDEVLMETTGGDTIDNLLKIKDGIDDVAKSIQGWIKAHPDEIMDFFNDLKSVDWKGFAQGFIQGMGTVAKGIQKIAQTLQNKDMQKLGRFLFDLQFFGTGLLVVGGLLKGSRYLIGGIVATFVSLGRAIAGLAGVAGGGAVISKLTKFFKGLGGLTKSASAVAGASGVAGTAAGAAGAGAIFKGFLPVIEIIGGIGAIVTEIVGFAALDTALASSAIKSMNKILTGINTMFKNIKGLKGQKLSDADMQGVKDSVSGMLNVYNALSSGDQETVDKGGVKSGQGGLGSMNYGKLRKMWQSINAMDTIMTHMSSIHNTLQKMKGFKGINEKSAEAITSFVTQLGGIYSAMDEAFDKNMDVEKATQLGEIVGTSKDLFANISEIVKLIPGLAKGIYSNVGTQVGRGSPLERIKGALTGENGLFSTIYDIYQSISTNLYGSDKKGVGASFSADDITRMTGTIDSVKLMFTSLGEIIGILPQIYSQLAPLQAYVGGTASAGRGTVLGNLKTQIVGLFDQIGDIYASMSENIPQDASGMAEKVDSVKTAIDTIGSIAGKLKSLGSGNLAEAEGPVFTAISNIKSMISQIGKAINTETIAQIQADIETFKTSIDTLFTTLNTDLSSIEVEAHIDGKVTGADELVDAINKADDRIRAAVASIKTYYHKTVTISIHRSVSLTGSNPASTDVGGGGGGSWGEGDNHHHLGGYIKRNGVLYRSKGGGTWMKPRGTDTVPAMLTLGEYVHRKEAVDFFGAKFMQKINNLDIRGAMRELSARAGMSSFRSGMSVTNNYTTNNNQTVNQNIHTNNPNFAFRRSSRYVEAL